MKRSRFVSALFLLLLLVISIVGIASVYAQDSEVTHETILAAIPDLENFAAQAEQTFVGEVDGSYAYIAFVVQGDLAIIYICDSLNAWAWIRAEVVDGQINVTHEDTGFQVDATVTSEGVTGTVLLTTDDDGSPATSHEFTTVPAVPGETGLARYADEFEVSGWIVTEDGIRGIRKRLQCNAFEREIAYLRELHNMNSDAGVRSKLADQIFETSLNATIAGCGSI